MAIDHITEKQWLHFLNKQRERCENQGDEGRIPPEEWDPVIAGQMKIKLLDDKKNPTSHDREYLVKISPTTKRQTIFSDMRLRLRNVIALTEPALPYGHFLDEGREAFEARNARQRRNAFGLGLIPSDMGDRDFEMTWESAQKEGYLSFKEIYPDVFREIKMWHPRNPQTVHGKPRAIYLTGAPRIGKTTFMKLLAFQLYDNETPKNRGHSNLIAFVSALELYNSWLRADDKTGKPQIEGLLKTTKYLFIDDIGSNHITPFFIIQLQHWLNFRLACRFTNGAAEKDAHKNDTLCWTFFTSNYLQADLEINETCLKRMRECAKEIIVGDTLKPKYSNGVANTSTLEGNPSNS